jgi:hypothetical protein
MEAVFPERLFFVKESLPDTPPKWNQNCNAYRIKKHHTENSNKRTECQAIVLFCQSLECEQYNATQK